jgi:Hydrazine synthase alpha subunit middle domain/WD40-like Beta Propeller Repeat
VFKSSASDRLSKMSNFRHRPFHQLRKIAQITLFLSLPAIITGCGGGTGSEQKPAVLDTPIAYIKRPIPVDDQGNPTSDDVRRVLDFIPGGDLYLRDRASPSAPERNITSRLTGGKGDVKDIAVSYDGKKLLFALHLPDVKNAVVQPTWNIWEYTIDNDELRRVIASATTAEEGEDIAPRYLPDGRIVFSSTRQRQSRATLLDEGKPQFSGLDEDLQEQTVVLHVMNADGTDIHQISFNQSHDLDPTVLNSGEILFSRWNHAGSHNAIDLYDIRPDGTELHIAYGAHSHNTGTQNSTIQFVRPREMPDGRVMSIIRPFTSARLGGDLVIIDVADYIDHDQPVWSSRSVLNGEGQTHATINDVHTDNTPSPGGLYSSADPLWDGTQRILVSWSPCRLIENNAIVPCTPERLAAANVQEAPPLYGLWLYDMHDNTQLPVVVPEEGTIITDVVALHSRSTLPNILSDKIAGAGLNPDYIAEGVGVLHIRSVYDVDGTDTTSTGIAALADPLITSANQRPARFLRIVKSVAIPDRTVLQVPGSAFGVSRQRLMREIIGYAPIEPDGSVMIKVPANVPLAISVLDANGRRTSAEHQNWVQVRPGETVQCNGCHNPSSSMPHSHPQGPPSINLGAPTTGLPFPNTDSGLWADMGETMAQTRARISCQTDCAALNPSVDVVFDDVWTDTAIKAKDPSIAYRYTALDTPVPTSAGCLTQWSATCRIVINYETHIHPLWSKPRLVLDTDDITVLADNTCTSCHSPVDAMGAPQVPAAQLDLSDGPSDQVADQFKAYRELLATDNEQAIIDGSLQDVLVPGTDAAGNSIFVPVPASPPMTPAGARASRFFNVFTVGGSHAGWLTDAELRLLSEWLDIGAQYYNNPFDIPTN